MKQVLAVQHAEGSDISMICSQYKLHIKHYLIYLVFSCSHHQSTHQTSIMSECPGIKLWTVIMTLLEKGNRPELSH